MPDRPIVDVCDSCGEKTAVHITNGGRLCVKCEFPEAPATFDRAKAINTCVGEADMAPAERLHHSTRLRAIADTIRAVADGGSTYGNPGDEALVDEALDAMEASMAVLEQVGAQLVAPVELKKRTGAEVGDEWFCPSCGRPVEAKEYSAGQPVCPMHRRLLLKLDTSGIKR